VTLLLVAVAGGVLAGLLRPPVGPRTTRIRLDRLWLLAAGAALQAVGTLVSGDLSTLATGASLVALIAFAASNPHLTGLAVIGIGLLANLAALVGNNGMPVRPEALVAADVVEAVELPTLSLDPPRHLERDSDRFAWLGDTIPVPIAHEVVSFGDLIVVAGFTDAVRDLARRRRRAWTEGDRASYLALATLASADQVCGTAPSGAPESGSQCSAKPERSAPATIDLDREAAEPASPPLVAAHHNR